MEDKKAACEDQGEKGGHDLASIQLKSASFRDSDPSKFSFGKRGFGAFETEHTDLPPRIIDPEASWYHDYWRVFVAVLVAYWVVAGPIYFAVVPRPSLELTICNSLIHLVFFIDMMISFCVSFEDKKTGLLNKSHAQVALRYLGRGFIPDLLSTIPYQLLWRIFAGGLVSRKWGEVFNALALLRLYRLPECFHLLSRLQKRGYVVYFTLAMFKLTTIVILSGHFAGCFMVFVARQEVGMGFRPEQTWYGATDPDWQEHGLFRSWLTGIYWAIITITSVGFGDYSMMTPFEWMFISVYGVLSMFMLAYSLGNVALLLVKEGSKTGVYHDKTRALKAYAQRTNMPPELNRELQEYLNAELRVGTDQTKLLDSFPRHLRAHVLRYQYGSMVANAHIFKGCSRPFLTSVVGSMDLETYLPNVTVVSEGDVADALYIVAEGTLVRERMRAGRTSSSEATLEVKNPMELVPGQVFGKVAVICNIPQLLTVRTKEVCRLLKLKKADFAKFLDAYPEDFRRILDNLTETVAAQKRSNTALSQEVRDMAYEVANLLSRRDLQVAAVCSAAAHGHLHRLQELLPHGDSRTLLNMADYDGCSPLHYAAAKGFAECVSYLIAHGADVNAEDNWGATPLLEAIRNGNAATIRALRQAGALLNLKDTGRVLAEAVGNGQAELLERLLEYGADVNAEGYDTRTALHVACAERNLALARMLLEFGADATKRDSEGVTPLDEAHATENQSLIALLEGALAKH